VQKNGRRVCKKWGKGLCKKKRGCLIKRRGGCVKKGVRECVKKEGGNCVKIEVGEFVRKRWGESAKRGFWWICFKGEKALHTTIEEGRKKKRVSDNRNSFKTFVIFKKSNTEFHNINFLSFYPRFI
jgi:hypothetical protein